MLSTSLFQIRVYYLYRGFGGTMRRFSLASISAVSAIALSQIASAADLPRKAPAPPLLPVLSWTGWYVGANAGGTWGANNSVDTVSQAVSGFGDGIGPGSFAANSALGATGSVNVGEDAGFIGGGQIGYNWQFASSWVVGFEADIQGISRTGAETLNTSVGPFPFFGVAEVINTQITSSREVNWLGTVRGRLGFLATPTLLVFGTGGFAYGGVKASTAISQSNNDCIGSPGICVVSFASSTGSLSETRTGWTAGGGLEWMFWQRWSAKFEYLYYDLGSVTFANSPLVTGIGSCGGACGGGTSIVNSLSTTKFTGNIARLGVNYHF